MRKLYDSGKTIADVKDIPSEYVLGAGHCKFFYNKLDWLYCRFKKLLIELEFRDYKIDLEKYESIEETMKDTMTDKDCSYGSLIAELVDDYEPTPEEIYKNMYRISVLHFKVDDVLFETKKDLVINQ